jgi:hypothetical protein
MALAPHSSCLRDALPPKHLLEDRGGHGVSLGAHAAFVFLGGISTLPALGARVSNLPVATASGAGLNST